MTTLLFVRHVEHALQGQVLLGRTHDADFTKAGKLRLEQLRGSLSDERVGAIYSSPRRRALATANTIAVPHHLPVTVCPELDELDYGEWSGRRFDELADDPRWRRWNDMRSAECPPQGESMAQLQNRMLAFIDELARLHAAETAICVTHGEPIRAVLLHSSNIPLDEFARVDAPPGSVTRITVVRQTEHEDCTVGARSA